MDPSVKEHLVARFRAYLERDEGEKGERQVHPDLFTLLAELAALKTEVKLESRQVKTALDQFRELFDSVQKVNDRLERELGRLREREGLTRNEMERDLLLEVLDLYDRLQAGRDQARKFAPNWLARRSGVARFVQTLAEGQDMTLRRIEDLLTRRGVHVVETQERPFDPLTMQATDTGFHPDLADGMVIEETRRGFIRHDRLLRPAEVIVNKKENNS